MENEVQTQEKSLAFWVTMLVVLFVAVFGIFAMLRMTFPQEWEAQKQMQEQEQTQIVEQEIPAPNFCPFCGDELPDSFAWGQYCPFCGENVAH